MRPVKLAKYLPSYGWRPVVLTAKNHDWYYGRDEALIDELPDQIEICRSPMLRSAWIYRILNPLRSSAMDRWIRRFLVQPDDQVGWLPTAFSSGLKIIDGHSIQAMYSTSAPMSCHIIAYFLKKKTGLPWIADFRDEWYENPDHRYPTRFHRRFHFQLEKKVVAFADQIITAASGFCGLLSKHPGCEEKCSTIFMGYDPAEFEKVSSKQGAKDQAGIFTIAFSGLFYSYFKPARVISAINSLIESRDIPKDRIRLLFVGANTPGETGAIDNYGICRFTGFLSHSKALEHVKGSDALLLLLSRERGAYVVPSKTFEYMASGKPIIAIVPKQSEVASIIESTRTGTLVDYEDLEGIRMAVLRMYRSWESGASDFKPDLDKIAGYSQVEQTRDFVGLLESIGERGVCLGASGDARENR